MLSISSSHPAQMKISFGSGTLQIMTTFHWTFSTIPTLLWMRLCRALHITTKVVSTEGVVIKIGQLQYHNVTIVFGEQP